VADGGQGRIPPEIKDILLKLRRAHTHTHTQREGSSTIYCHDRYQTAVIAVDHRSH